MNLNEEERDVLFALISEGPLDQVELARRARVSTFNFLNDVFNSSKSVIYDNGIHSETRQVLAASAVLTDIIARKIVEDRTLDVELLSVIDTYQYEKLSAQHEEE